MAHEPGSRSRAVLDPLDRSSEVLFGRHPERRRPLPVGLTMVALGVALSTIAIQLGG
jgi:hypothetical protein